jgi:CAAX prenyl protease N-terminal, five membrane helices
VARARSYQRPLYWAGIADVAIEASVLATLVWSGAGAALDPGSLPWWGRTPAYAAIVVAAAAAVRTPLALWSGLIRERRWGFSTQRLPSWVADRAKAVGLNIVLTAVALLGLVGFARALPGWWVAPAAAAAAFATLMLSFLAPVVLEPLFNRYSPLQDAATLAASPSLAQLVEHLHGKEARTGQVGGRGPLTVSARLRLRMGLLVVDAWIDTSEPGAGRLRKQLSVPISADPARRGPQDRAGGDRA